MSRWVGRWLAPLVGALLVTGGCIGPLATQSTPTDTVGDQASPGSNVPSDPVGSEDEVDVVSLVLRLGLTEHSRIPLKVQSVNLDPNPGQSVRVATTEGRLSPGAEALTARLTAQPGTLLPTTELEVTLFDGLGQVNFTAKLGAVELDGDVEQTIVLDNDGPSRIAYARSEGPIEVDPEPEHAVPQYGYLLWPDGKREALPGFQHVVHVPEAFPNLPEGEEASFFVEAPDEEDVVWRVDGEDPHRGPSFSFTPDVGQHHLRVSVGPGNSATSLTVHTDFQERVNGTVVAATPGVDRTVEPVNGAEHAFEVKEKADGVKLTLRSLDGTEALEDLDLSLLDRNGEEIGASHQANQTQETLYYDGLLQPGEHTALIEAEDGAALDYTLEIRVDY